MALLVRFRYLALSLTLVLTASTHAWNGPSYQFLEKLEPEGVFLAQPELQAIFQITKQDVIGVLKATQFKRRLNLNQTEEFALTLPEGINFSWGDGVIDWAIAQEMILQFFHGRDTVVTRRNMDVRDILLVFSAVNMESFVDAYPTTESAQVTFKNILKEKGLSEEMHPSYLQSTYIPLLKAVTAYMQIIKQIERNDHSYNRESDMTEARQAVHIYFSLVITTYVEKILSFYFEKQDNENKERVLNNLKDKFYELSRNPIQDNLDRKFHRVLEDSLMGENWARLQNVLLAAASATGSLASDTANELDRLISYLSAKEIVQQLSRRRNKFHLQISNLTYESVTSAGDVHAQIDFSAKSEDLQFRRYSYRRAIEWILMYGNGMEVSADCAAIIRKRSSL